MKFPLLLLDANVVIHLHELGMRENLLTRCRVTITETVKEESKYREDSNGNHHLIELDSAVKIGKLNCIENIPPETVEMFSKQYGPAYMEKNKKIQTN